MRHRTRLGASALAAALSLAGATGCEEEARDDTGDGEVTVFTSEDRAIAVAAGEAFTLELAENPTTGYEWELVEPLPDRAVVTPLGDRYESDDPDGPPGTGGTAFLDFRAEEPGSTEIHVVERRGADETAGDLAFTVTVG